MTSVKVAGVDSGDIEANFVDQGMEYIARNMELGQTSVALEIPDMLTGIVRLLGFKDRHTLRRVNRFWKDIIESPPVCRSVKFDQTTRVSTAIEHCQRTAGNPYSHLTIIAAQCSSSRAFYSSDLAAQVFNVLGLLPRVKTVVLYGGHVGSMALASGFCGSDAPRVVLRDVIIHGCVSTPSTTGLFGVHVRVISGVLDPVKMFEGNHICCGWQDKACHQLRELVVTALDAIPLARPEEDLLTKITEIPEGQHRDLVRTALKLLNPDCFKPEMNVPGAEIHLAKSTLRNATLHICQAIVWQSKMMTYRCTDLTCCPLPGRSIRPS